MIENGSIVGHNLPVAAFLQFLFPFRIDLVCYLFGPVNYVLVVACNFYLSIITKLTCAVVRELKTSTVLFIKGKI
jgi:hypothetical protein